MRKAVRKIIESRIFYILASLVAAFLLWQFVVTSVNPSQTSNLTFYVQYEGEGVLSAYNLRLASDSPQSVTLRVEASTADMRRLQDDPNLIVDVSGIREAGEYDVRFTFAAANVLMGVFSYEPLWGVSNTDNTIIVRVNRITGRTMPLSATGISYEIAQAPVGADYIYVGGDELIEPESVQIDGPEEILNQIAVLEVYCEFLSPLTETTTQTGSIRAYDHDGELIPDADLQEVTLNGAPFDQATVNVTVTVLIAKELPILPVFEFGAGANADNLEYRLTPDAVWLVGEKEMLQDEAYVRLERIHLDQVGTVSTVRRPILTPHSTEIFQGGIDFVDIDIQIRGLTEMELLVPYENVRFSNLPEGIDAEVVTDTIRITLRGPEEILEELEENSITILINLVDFEGRAGPLVIENFTVQVRDYDPEIVGAMDLPDRGIAVNLRRR
ncbi:MAG: CdaR family protein [Oscillospiraceae bacterium]|nr:CdaR family protein [Oscillospiraceae bacterium]